MPSPAWKTCGSPVKTCLIVLGVGEDHPGPFVGDVEREHVAVAGLALLEHPLRLARPDRGLDRARHRRPGRQAAGAGSPAGGSVAVASPPSPQVHATPTVARCRVRSISLKTCSLTPPWPARPASPHRSSTGSCPARASLSAAHAADGSSGRHRDRRAGAGARHPRDPQARRAARRALADRRPAAERGAGLRSAAPASSAGPPIPMAELLEFELPGPDGPIAARLYVPHGAPPPPRPMLVHYHGGGWVIGDLETHDGACRFLAAHSGAAVLSTDLPPRPRAPLPGPGRRRRRPPSSGPTRLRTSSAPTRRIAVGGDSAGGNLAAGVCLAMRDAAGRSRRCSC